MIITSPYEKYRQSAVSTSSPSQLLLMLYDGAIRFGRAALEGIETADYSGLSINVGKARAIVKELTNTLDASYEVSAGLKSMYEYIDHLLSETNINKSKTAGEEAIGYLLELRQTFAQAAKMSAGQAQQHG
ncbi:flagellar export chaperone FliS [Paenibacillus sp. FSL R7-0345]|uniref:flagellar export chaperone FliS n=1 Tax=Paenibacillus sp. FSL R7-0345 TaxID=2954535 RepID=UPI00315A00FA